MGFRVFQNWGYVFGLPIIRTSGVYITGPLFRETTTSTASQPAFMKDCESSRASDVAAEPLKRITPPH